MKQSAELHLHGLFSIFGCMYCTVSTTQPCFLRSSAFAGTSSARLVSFTNDISLRFQKRGRKHSAPGEMEQVRGDQPRTCRLLPLPWRGPASVRGGTAMQGWSRLAKVWWVCQGMARWPREHGNWRCTPPVGRNVWPVRHCSDFTFISFPFLFILN